MTRRWNSTTKMTVLEYENHLHETEPRWFAIYTGYKREKRVVAALKKKGITAYCPLLQLTRHYTRKTKRVDIPLINCYVFVQITKEQYVPVLETQDVFRFVSIARNLLAIPEAEINLLKRIVGEQLPIEVDTTSFQEGDDVEVIAGQLTGLQGKLLEKRGQHKLVVSLQTLGYDLLMEVNPAHIRRVSRLERAMG